MILSIIWPLLIAVLGLLMWVVSANPKVSEAGRILFFCGVFWVTAILSNQKLTV